MSENYPLSVITINYENREGLKRTVESVLGQRHKNFEYIVIDGFSRDGSVSYLEQISGSIDQLVIEQDHGVYDAMNKGIALAKGDYILFLNSGDLFYSNNSVERIFHNLDQTDLIAFDIHIEGLGLSFVKEHPDHLRMSYLYNNTLAHQSTLIRRELFEKIGVYDSSLKVVADWKFFVLAAVRVNCSYKAIHEILTFYNLEGFSATPEGTFIRKNERKHVIESDLALFHEDYEKLQLLSTNRFKLLIEMESSWIGRKMMSSILRIMVWIKSPKRLKLILRSGR